MLLASCVPPIRFLYNLIGFQQRMKLSQSGNVFLVNATPNETL